MNFAKIEENICVNIMVFDTIADANNFDSTLIEIEEGFGIGDLYIDNQWQKREITLEEQIFLIDAGLKEIDDQGVTRHLENQIEASNTYDNIYESTKILIDKKNELRAQRKELYDQLQAQKLEELVNSQESNV